MTDEKFCRDCRHVVTGGPYTTGANCRSPALGLNLVTGELNMWPCDVLRAGAGPGGRTCGRGGDWFEPREVTS